MLELFLSSLEDQLGLIVNPPLAPIARMSIISEEITRITSSGLTKRAPDRLAAGGRKHPARAIKQIKKLLVKHAASNANRWAAVLLNKNSKGNNIMAKCFSCGKKDCDPDGDLCRGCLKIVCVECARKYEHMGNGLHGRRPTLHAPDGATRAAKKGSISGKRSVGSPRR